MKPSEKWFAKPLIFEVRFIAALIITKRKFKSVKSYTELLLLLFHNEELWKHRFELLRQQAVVSKEFSSDVREFFISLFEDEDKLVAYLNRETSEKFFTIDKKDKDVVDQTLDNVFKIAFSKLGISV